MDEHQPRVQLLAIAGQKPTKASTSALALGHRIIVACTDEFIQDKGHTEHIWSEQGHKSHVSRALAMFFRNAQRRPCFKQHRRVGATIINMLRKLM